MSARRAPWLLVGAVLLAIVLVVTIAVAVPSLRQGRIGGGPAADSPSVSPPPPPSETLYLTGYDPDPGPLDLGPVTTTNVDPITVSLALGDHAVHTGGAIGLSFDATELASPLWDSSDSNLALTLAELDRPVLRFGGNGVDRRMWWTSSDEAAPGWAEAVVTPESLARVAAVADQVDAEVTISLDLGHDDPARAADMAAHAQEAFGDRLLAVSIGNEPNGFFHENQPQLAVRDKSWGPDAYQDSVREYAAAIEKTAPGTPIAGPGAYDAPWWRAFAEAGIDDEAALTMHWYPLWDCTGPDTSIANPTIEDLTSPALREQARKILGMGRDVATENSLPLWMEETGPTSCPGTNDTSLTHAQALWTVDYAFTAMEEGVSRIAFHSTLQACRGGAPMSPLCASGELEDPGPIVEGRTSYLALMLLGQLPDGQVLSAATSGDGTIIVHGVIDQEGQLALVVLDLRDPSDPSATDAPVRISAPEGTGELAPKGWTLKNASQLTGTALAATESSLHGAAPVTGSLSGAVLERADPLDLASSPGTITVLSLEPVKSD
ncbi:hypothetical protein [Brachybacterium tyrofermentans]|uniref:hypothetical protein n=1 Tax=Brachybacterium tyrofermentans TaxID=47848 RepID=UPI003FD3FF17